MEGGPSGEEAREILPVWKADETKRGGGVVRGVQAKGGEGMKMQIGVDVFLCECGSRTKPLVDGEKRVTGWMCTTCDEKYESTQEQRAVWNAAVCWEREQY